MLLTWLGRFNAVVTAKVSMTAGALTFAGGLLFPVYTDPELAAQIKRNACDGGRPRPNWWEGLDALETLRHPLMQTGSSLILVGLALLFLHKAFPGEGKGRLRTPGNLPAFFALGLLALATSWAGLMYGVILQARRGDVPWCADSIAIPFVAGTVNYLVFAVICVVIGAAVILAFRSLPVSLEAWDSKRPIRSWIVSLVFGSAMMVVVALGVLMAPTGMFLSSFAHVLMLYLLASSRAALLGPMEEGSEVGR